MKKIIASTRLTLLIVATSLAAHTYAAGDSASLPDPSSPPGSPKLTDDGPPGTALGPATSGQTQKVNPSVVANSPARAEVRPRINAIASGRLHSKHCRLEDTAPAVSFDVPMATRWWWTNKAQDDVKFCVVAGAITSAKSAWVLPASYSLSVWSGSNSVVPMSAGSGAATLMVGGAIAPSTTLWAMFPPGARMGSNEFCTSGTVKYSVLSKHQLKLKLLHPNGAGACSIRFTDAPWVDLRAQVVPKNIPKQTQ